MHTPSAPGVPATDGIAFACRQVVERLPDPVLVFDAASDGGIRLVAANTAALRWLGVDELPAAGELERLPPGPIGEELKAGVARCLASGEGLSHRYTDDAGRTFEIGLDPARNGEGGPIQVIGIVRPVDDRFTASQLALLQVALDQVHEAAQLIDQESRLRYVNAEACRSLGYSRDELLTMRVGDFDPEWPPERWREGWELVRRNGSLSTRSVHRRKDGATFPVEITIGHLRFEGREYAIALIRDISEQVQMEARLHAQAEEFRALAENSPDVIIRYDRECRRLYANPAMERLTGRPLEAILGKRPSDQAPVLSAPPPFEAKIRRVFETGEPEELLFTGHDARGEFFWAQARFIPERDAEGRVATVLAIGHYITELKAAEQQWRTLMENLPGMVVRFDREARMLYANPNVLKVFGKTMDGVIGSTPPGEDADGRPLVEVIKEVAASGKEHLTEVTWTTPAGIRHYSVRHVPERSEGGEVKSVLGIATDVTALVESQQALRAERAIFMRGPTVVFKWKAAAGWPVEYVSPNVLDQFGYSDESLTSGQVAYAALVHPDDLQRVGAEVAAGSRRDATFAQAYRIRHADGRYRYVQDFTSVIRDASGVVTGYYGYVIDVTEFRRSEERLRLLNFALDNVREEAYLLDEQARFQYVNEGAARALGYSRDDLLRMRLDEVDPDYSGERWTDHWRELKESGSMLFEGRHRESGGRLYPVEISANYFEYDGHGYNLALARDITDRREAEQAMRRLNRALKTLSSGNEALVRAGDEKELLAEMCRVLAEVGGYPLAWIGLPNPDGAPVPAAWAGEEGGFLAAREHYGEDNDPGAAAARTGETQLVRDLDSQIESDLYREEAHRRGLRACAAFPLRINSGHFGVLSIYAADPASFDLEEVSLLAEMANDLAYGIRSLHARGDRERFMERLRSSMQSTIQALSNTVELRDPYTAGHQRRVANFAAAVARDLGWSDERIQVIYLTGLVHDIGKVAVPSEILSKPGRLNAPELALVRTHAEAGYEILKSVEFPWPIAEYVRQHHERLDGSGYPLGIQGEEVLPEARLLAVCDVVEAMTTHRPYRPGLGLDRAIDEIVSQRGTLFDADIVDACVRVIRERGFRFE